MTISLMIGGTVLLVLIYLLVSKQKNSVEVQDEDRTQIHMIEIEINEQAHKYQEKFDHLLRSKLSRVEHRLEGFIINVQSNLIQEEKKLKTQLTTKAKKDLSDQGFFDRLTSGFDVGTYFGSDLYPKIQNHYNFVKSSIENNLMELIKEEFSHDFFYSGSAFEDKNSESTLGLKDATRGAAVSFLLGGAGSALGGGAIAAFPPVALIAIPIILLTYDTDEELLEEIKKATHPLVNSVFTGSGFITKEGNTIPSLKQSCEILKEKQMQLINLKCCEVKDSFLFQLKEARDQLQSKVQDGEFQKNYKKIITLYFEDKIEDFMRLNESRKKSKKAS